MKQEFITETGQVMNLFLVFQFLKRLTTPFNKTDAYKLGIIDERGKRTSKPMKSKEEKESWRMFDRLVFRLKMLIEKLPFGKSRLASYAAALFLVKESETWSLGDTGVDSKKVENLLNENIKFLEKNASKNFRMLREGLEEDAPAVAVGTGNIAGAGPGEDPPVGKKKKKKKKVNDPSNIGRKTFSHFMGEEAKLSKNDLDEIERFADKIFSKLKIDVEFTRHFLDRVNDSRNNKQINKAELVRLFKKEKEKHGKKIAQLGPDAEAVLADLQTDVNSPFVLKWDDKNQELDMVMKTVMRKKDFKTSDKKFSVEDIFIQGDITNGGRQYPINELAISKPKQSATHGIPRKKMPQVASKDYPELLKYFQENGAGIKNEVVSANKLKAVQKDFSDTGIASSIQKGLNGAKGKPLIASKDGYIIDGHHRWLAAINTNPSKKIPIVRVNLTVKPLLKLVINFPKTTFKDIYESIIDDKLSEIDSKIMKI